MPKPQENRSLGGDSWVTGKKELRPRKKKERVRDERGRRGRREKEIRKKIK
jgi:hypothetical protein